MSLPNHIGATSGLALGQFGAGGTYLVPPGTPRRGRSVTSRRAAALALLAALVAAAGAARGFRGGPCADDADRFCAHVPPGPGHVLACLREHRADLSPQCARTIGAGAAPRPSFRSSCGADMARLCPTVSPGRGRLLRCLRLHERDLSDTCREELARMRR